MSPAIPERVARLILSVQAWAVARPDVLGVAIVGSHARGSATPESDVDLVLVCESPTALVADADWVRAFGEPQSVEREDWGRVTSLRVRYADGLEVEFGIADRTWASAPLDPGTRRVIEDGCIVLFDRGSAFSGVS
jgi:predicted nucleotidyltransferase